MSFLPYTRQIIATILLSVGLTSQAAVVHDVENGQLIGAKGVEVGGVFYDVAFGDGIYSALFPSIPEYHDTETEAEAFALALINDVFLDGGSAATAFDSDPRKTSGCSVFFCQVLIPYELNPTTLEVSYRASNNSVSIDFTGSAASSDGFDTGLYQDTTFAVFTPSVSAVPEPTTYAMLAAGLLVLAGFSRRSNRV